MQGAEDPLRRAQEESTPRRLVSRCRLAHEEATRCSFFRTLALRPDLARPRSSRDEDVGSKGSKGTLRLVPTTPHPTVSDAAPCPGETTGVSTGHFARDRKERITSTLPREHRPANRPEGRSDDQASKTRIRLRSQMFPSIRLTAHRPSGPTKLTTRAESLVRIERAEARRPAETFRTGGQDCRATEAADTGDKPPAREGRRPGLPPNRPHPPRFENRGNSRFEDHGAPWKTERNAGGSRRIFPEAPMLCVTPSGPKTHRTIPEG